MDLTGGYPYWVVNSGLPVRFDPIGRDIDCDVAIIGAGITGALIARELVQAGFDTVVLDKRDAGWGSTSASTALIQYEIDTELVDLSRQIGVAAAVASYRACERAVLQLAAIAGEVRGSGFTRARSLYIASRRWHARRVRAEGALRSRHGFELEVLDHDELGRRFGIAAPAGLLSAVAGQVDPYRLALGLLSAARKRGARVHDRSEVVHWQARPRGVDLLTAGGARVRCRHLVIAAGYESQKYLPKRVASNRSSYAIATEPLRDAPAWLRDTLVWESARPYLYLRSTPDRRLIIGGEDDRVDIAAKRDALVATKARRLLNKLHKLLPELEPEPGFAWAGTFAETADGLPYFGPHEAHGPRVHFAMAYGGNGIVYSVIGAEILRARIERRRHPLQELFSFSRTS